MEYWQPVEFTGGDDPEAGLYQGHPGRVLDPAQGSAVVAVGFVSGPRRQLPVEQLGAIGEAEYLRRGRRLVR